MAQCNHQMSLLAPAIKTQLCGIFISLSSERSLDACVQPTFLHPPVIQIIKTSSAMYRNFAWSDTGKCTV